MLSTLSYVEESDFYLKQQNLYKNRRKLISPISNLLNKMKSVTVNVESLSHAFSLQKVSCTSSCLVRLAWSGSVLPQDTHVEPHLHEKRNTFIYLLSVWNNWLTRALLHGYFEHIRNFSEKVQENFGKQMKFQDHFWQSNKNTTT